MARFQLASLGIGVLQDTEGRPIVGTSFTVSGGPLYAASTGPTELSGAQLVTGALGLAPGWLDPATDPGTYSISYAGSTAVSFAVGDATLDGRLDAIEAGTADAALKPDATAGVAYVDPVNGSDAFDGLSWGTAKATISAAITAITSGTIYLAEGNHDVSAAISIPNFVGLVGMGESTVVRATGNHYIFNLNPANRAFVRNLTVAKSGAAQSSGGAFDFTNARNNIRIDDIYVGAGLHTTFNITPNATSGHFYISRVKWNGSTGGVNGLVIGDGTNLVAHTILDNLLCVPATAGDMTNFMVVRNNVDTLKANCVELYGATNGILIGAASSGDVTDTFWSRCLVDLVTNVGVDIVKCRGFGWTDGQIQTCGYGLQTASNAKGVKFSGGTIQNCANDGGTILGGADLTFENVMICDNNTSNGAFGQGLDIVSATRLRVLDCTIGNNVLLSSGHQKYGVNLASGSSPGFTVKGCTFTGNETAPMQNLNTSGSQCIEGNVGLQMPTVASAATVTLPGDPVITISGTTTITSITASWAGRRVTLIFSGALTFTDGSNLKLNGNFVTTADDTITLVCDGTNWFEQARSVN